MKTIQDYFRELDRDKLIDTYLYLYPVNYDLLENGQDRSIRQIRTAIREDLASFIDRLINMKAVPAEEPCILFGYRCINDDFDDVDFTMIKAKELEGDLSAVSGYAFEFCKQEEIMSYLVSEAPLTQRYIYELAAYVMDEASFFGFEQEDLETELEKLDKSIKEIEDGTAEYISYEELKADLDAESGLDPDEESEDEKELHSKVILAKIEYTEHSKVKELNALKSLIAGRNNGL